MINEEKSLTRINKHLSEIGYCSRREADRLIAAGRVLVNGKKAEMGLKIGTEDQITVNGEALNKPKNKSQGRIPKIDNNIITEKVSKN